MIIRETKSMSQTERMESRNSNFLYQDKALKEHVSQNKATPHIIDSGKSGIWSYRKWSNGVAECWGMYHGIVNITTSGRGSYYTTVVVNFPADLFISGVTANANVGLSSGFAYCGISGTPSASSVHIIFVCQESMSNVTADCNIYARGRWTEEISPDDYDDIPIVDQTYDPESANAQSGTAVAEAISGEEKRANDTYANALKGTVSGETVSMSDVSPVSHEMAVKVRGKNLIPYPFHDGTTIISGVTFTDNNDGTIIANGTASDDVTYIIASYIPLKGTYTLSGTTNGSVSTYFMVLGTSDYADTGNGVTRTYNEKSNQNIFIRIKNGTTVDNVEFYPQLELGSSATAYTPYISDLKS